MVLAPWGQELRVDRVGEDPADGAARRLCHEPRTGHRRRVKDTQPEAHVARRARRHPRDLVEERAGIQMDRALPGHADLWPRVVDGESDVDTAVAVLDAQPTQPALCGAPVGTARRDVDASDELVASEGDAPQVGADEQRREGACAEHLRALFAGHACTSVRRLRHVNMV